jgi:hypothetical protein
VGIFEAFYASPAQHPFLLWIATGVAFAWATTRPGLDPSLRRYCALLTALSLTDAWLTTIHVFGFGELSGWQASAVPLFFVLAGDFRFLLLFAVATRRGAVEPNLRGFLAAAGLTLIVPIFSQGVVTLLPEASSGPRVLFLVYEVAFVLLTAALLRWHPAVGSVPWLKPVSCFVLLYYALWASADLIILSTGSDLGFLLRVLPNLLYYGGLIAVIATCASRASRESAGIDSSV